MKVKKGDTVKHKDVHIQGEVVQIDKAEKGEQPVVHVRCEGGTYYDPMDRWEPVKK
ncbi:hypothetical protein [Myxococcus sp. CA039A]|uniref:hypothetical protein n=1 Tax=Myxococcus sp. CA039A TaxID=2741737 RepID=UPI00157B9D4A|nr:hypothetical protein [Myxococcus sp. CA039A]NTX58852.1 hypothetical protein [Myxococcus sp. CA039A]